MTIYQWASHISPLVSPLGLGRIYSECKYTRAGARSRTNQSQSPETTRNNFIMNKEIIGSFWNAQPLEVTRPTILIYFSMKMRFIHPPFPISSISMATARMSPGFHPLVQIITRTNMTAREARSAPNMF